MDGRSLLCFAAFVVSCAAYIVLKDKEHIQLNDASGGKSINASTSNRLAFDEKHNILYVVGRFVSRCAVFCWFRGGPVQWMLLYTCGCGHL